MAEILGSPPRPRTVIFWNGAAWQWALVDAAGHLQMDVIASGLPLGAATAANQALMVTALQLIDNLVVTMGGPGNVRLQVRGENQLFSFQNTLINKSFGAVSGVDGYRESIPVIAGEIWKVTNVIAANTTRATTWHVYYLNSGGNEYQFHDVLVAIAGNERTVYQGELWMIEGDTVRIYFTGSQAADQCLVVITGYRMTLET